MGAQGEGTAGAETGMEPGPARLLGRGEDPKQGLVGLLLPRRQGDGRRQQPGSARRSAGFSGARPALDTLFTGNKYSAAGSGPPAPPLALLRPVLERLPAERTRERQTPVPAPFPSLPTRGRIRVSPTPPPRLGGPRQPRTHSRPGAAARQTSPAWHGQTWLMLKARPPGGTWQLWASASRRWHTRSPCRRAQQPSAPQSSSRWHRAPGEAESGVRGGGTPTSSPGWGTGMELQGLGTMGLGAPSTRWLGTIGADAGGRRSPHQHRVPQG